MGMGKGLKCIIKNRAMCQRGPWDSVELPLGELSPSCVPSCPNTLASSTNGWDREPRRRIWDTFDWSNKLDYRSLFIYLLSFPRALPPLFSQQEATVVSLLSPLLFPFRQKCPQWSASPLLNARQRGYKTSQRERLASCGQIMNIFNMQQKDCDPAVTGTFHITTFHMWGNNWVNESNAYYIFISLLLWQLWTFIWWS